MLLNYVDLPIMVKCIASRYLTSVYGISLVCSFAHSVSSSWSRLSDICMLCAWMSPFDIIAIDFHSSYYLAYGVVGTRSKAKCVELRIWRSSRSRQTLNILDKIKRRLLRYFTYSSLMFLFLSFVFFLPFCSFVVLVCVASGDHSQGL